MALAELKANVHLRQGVHLIWGPFHIDFTVLSPDGRNYAPTGYSSLKNINRYNRFTYHS